MMKKNFLSMAGITLAGALLFSSCIGSFNLSNKLLAWNKTLDNKFVNEVVFLAFCIVPVYEVCLFADLVVLNSIEFWTGENPVEAGLTKTVKGENGNYTVETLENGYRIQNENGQEVDLIYDKASNTWNAEAEGESTKIIQIDDENSATVYLPDGTEQKVELNAAGVLAFRQTVENTTFFAAR